MISARSYVYLNCLGGSFAEGDKGSGLLMDSFSGSGGGPFFLKLAPPGGPLSSSLLGNLGVGAALGGSFSFSLGTGGFFLSSLKATFPPMGFFRGGLEGGGP